jgi:hypothetical protein
MSLGLGLWLQAQDGEAGDVTPPPEGFEGYWDDTSVFFDNETIFFDQEGI